MRNASVLEWKSLLSRLFLWGYVTVLLVPIAVRIPLPMNLAVIGGIVVVALLVSTALLEGFGRLYDRYPQKFGFHDNTKYNYFGAAVFGVTLGLFTLYWRWQYPGGMSVDTADQLIQAMLGDYNDWHPVLHTLLFFSLPMKAGAELGGIVWLQLAYFSAAFAYLVTVLAQRDMPKLWLGLVCGYVWLNPFLATFLMYPWKDMAMMIFAMLLVGYYIQIFCSGGAWLYKWRNVLALGVVTVLCCYMRHNAILFVGPLLVFALWFGRKRKGAPVKVVAVMLACVLLVQSLYGALDVEKPAGRIVETVGLPATVWCNVMKKNPGALPEDTRNVMYEIAAQEAYDTVYITGSFNSLKWDAATNVDRIDQMTYGEVLQYTLECFRYAPGPALEGLAVLTHLIWSIEGDSDPMEVEIMDNDWGIEETAHHPMMQGWMDWCAQSRGTRILFGSLGLWNLGMILAALILFMRNRTGFMHALPLLCYNFGTMLLLSGRDYRFFLFNLPIWLAVIYLMCLDKREIFPVKQ